MNIQTKEIRYFKMCGFLNLDPRQGLSAVKIKRAAQNSAHLPDLLYYFSKYKNTFKEILSDKERFNYMLSWYNRIYVPAESYIDAVIEIGFSLNNIPSMAELNDMLNTQSVNKKSIETIINLRSKMDFLSTTDSFDSLKDIYLKLHDCYFEDSFDDDDDDDNYDDDDDDDNYNDDDDVDFLDDDIHSVSAVNSFKVPSVCFDDIVGLDNVKSALKERIVLPAEFPELFAKYNLEPSGGILLYGVPGTGKTMMAQAVAHEIEAKFFYVRVSDIESQWVGVAEKNIAQLFKQARKCERAVVFFDEFDALGAKRTNGSIRRSSASTLQEILTQMQGIYGTASNVIVMAATNNPQSLDSALLRPGRFDYLIEIPLPDKLNIQNMLEKELLRIPQLNSVDFSHIAKTLLGCSGADIVQFCRRIKLKLIDSEITGDGCKAFETADIEMLAKDIEPSVSKNDLNLIKQFKSRSQV